MTPGQLTAVRVEPVMRARAPAIVLDLHFDDGTRHAALPFVFLDVAKCAEGDGDPLVFPAVAAALDDRVAAAVIEIVLDRLLPAALRRGPWLEELIILGDGRRVVAAREHGWFAAAPLERALPPVAPAIYARRFAARRAALTYGPQAPALAGFLAGAARRVGTVDGDPEGGAWFGTADVDLADVELAVGSGPAPAPVSFVVRTDLAAPRGVPVVAPLAADVLVSFDPQDGPVISSFVVESALEPPQRTPVDVAPAIVGRSAGRVALVLRPNALAARDADLEEAEALAHGLAAEGFTVSLTTDIAQLAAAQPDLVHLMGVAPGDDADAAARWAVERDLPLAVHAFEEGATNGSYWGASATVHCFTYAGDERVGDAYLGMLARRRVEIDGVSAHVPYAPPRAHRAQAEDALRRAGVVFAGSEGEAAALRVVGVTGEIVIVPSAVGPAAVPEPIGALVGDVPFALVLAPLHPAANQLIALRAAALAQIRLVIAGAPEDPLYAELVRSVAGDAVLLSEPSRGERAALLAAARVLLDPAWIGRGGARIAAAALAGANLAVAATRIVPFGIPGEQRFDPADVSSVARALGHAWDGAATRDPGIERRSGAVRAAQRATVTPILDAYAKLASLPRRVGAHP